VTLLMPQADLIVWDGASLVYAPGTPALAFPAGIMASLTRTESRVVGISDTTWTERSGNVAKRVDQLLGIVGGTKTLFDCAGTKNINSGQTAAQIIAEAETYWDARRAAGFDFIISTTVPDSVGFDAGEDTKRADLNAAIIASASLDAVVDLTGIAALNDASNTTYFHDGTHFTATGAALVVAPGLAAYQGLVP